MPAINAAVPLRNVTPGAEAIPMLSTAKLEKEYDQAALAWAEKHLMGSLKKRSAGKAWAAESERVCREGLRMLILDLDAEAVIGSLADAAEKLTKGGCDDPLVSWVAYEALLGKRGNWRDGEAALNAAVRRVRDDSTLDGVLGCLVFESHIDLLDKRSHNTDRERSELLALSIRSLRDGSYDEADEVVVVRHQIRWKPNYDDNSEQTFLALISAWRGAPISEWAKLTLEGIAETDIAWLKRSSDTADQVSQNQWDGFAKHLEVAHGLLDKAWRLRKDRPEAAAQMIRVTMGEGMAVEALRAWFDRAVSAQFDYAPAYKFLLWAYRPRWGGSHELMVEFGSACSATNRFDTWIPWFVFQACADVTSEVIDARSVFSNERAKSAVLAASKGYLDRKEGTELFKQCVASHAVMGAFLAGDYDLAATALRKAGPRLHQSARSMLQGMLHHEPGLRRDIAAGTGELGEEVKKLELISTQRDPKALDQALAAIDLGKLTNPSAKAYVQETRDWKTFIASLSSTQWLPLPFHEGLSTFMSTGGEWSVEANGDLVATGNDQLWADLIFANPLPADVEIRGEIVFELPDESVVRDGYGFGPIIGWMPPSIHCDGDGVRGLLLHYEKGYEVAQVLAESFRRSSGERRLEFKPVNKFQLRAKGGKVSYIVNGDELVSELDVETIGLADTVGLAGLSSFRLPFGAKVRVRQLEVKKIAEGEPITAEAASSYSQSEITNLEKKASPTINSYLKWGAVVVVLIAALLVGIFVKPREE